MGNYVIAGWGNYLIANPSNLGNFMIADTVFGGLVLATQDAVWVGRRIRRSTSSSRRGL
jgi:hypothetical protein